MTFGQDPRKRPLYWMAGLSLLLAPTPGQSADAPFGIVSSRMIANAPYASICLDFGQSLTEASHAFLANALRLTRDGTRVRVTPQDLDITGSELCLGGLAYTHRYQLSIRPSRTNSGSQFADPIDHTFDVPARAPALGFVTEAAYDAALMRVSTDQARRGATGIRLRAVNVDGTRVELFRIEDRAAWPAAFEQMRMGGLAPSENLYFARTRGQRLWQSDLVLAAKPNEDQITDIPLPDVIAPGLYFLAAAPTGSAAGAPDLTTGLWLNVSDLTIMGMATPDGYEAFVSNVATSNIPAKIPVSLLAADGRVLAEATTDAQGVAHLPAMRDAMPALIAAQTKEGSALLEAGSILPTLPSSPPAATMELDRPLYMAGAQATVQLYSRDAKGHPVVPKDTRVRLVSPDGVAAYEEAVPPSGGIGVVSLPLPITAQHGLWTLEWRQADTVLATESLRLSPDGLWPHIAFQAKRSNLDENGNATLSIRVLDDMDKPLAGQAGHVTARTSQFSSHPDERGIVFGGGSDNATIGAPLPFVTDANGTAVIVWKAEPTARAPSRTAIAFQATLDRGGDSDEMILPVRHAEGWVGIRPYAEDRVFPENSAARFTVMALDPNGHSRIRSDLRFVVYEKGRRFTWFTHEGRWNYKPLPERRRIGGGAVTMDKQGLATVQWPVTAGHYELNLVDDAGATVAYLPFSAAGWRQPSWRDVSSDGQRFHMDMPAGPLHPGQTASLSVHLDMPAIVAITLGDGPARQTIQISLPAGDHTVPFTPRHDWRRSVPVLALAGFANGTQERVKATMRLQQPDDMLPLTVEAPPSVTAGSPLTLTVRPGTHAPMPEAIHGVATPLSDDGQTLPSEIVTKAKPGHEGWTVTIPTPVFTGTMTVTITAWNGAHIGHETLTLPAKPPLTLTGSLPDPIRAGDTVKATLRITNNSAPSGTYHYSLTGPPGLEIVQGAKGSITSRRGKSDVIRVRIKAAYGLGGTLRLALSGPRAATQDWPVRIAPVTAPTWTAQTLDPGKDGTAAVWGKAQATAAAFIAAAPLGPTPVLAWNLAAHDPDGVDASARAWIALNAWHQSLASSGLVGEDVLDRTRTTWQRRILMGQKPDGRFTDGRPGASDMVTTALALRVLGVSSDKTIKDTAARAAQWLDRALDNPWFDEAERPDRAMALAALAETGHADVSILRYFAQTSRDRTLSSQGAADLALALALAHEDEAAAFWTQRARAALTSGPLPPDQAWALVSRLARLPGLSRADIEAMIAPLTQPLASSAAPLSMVADTLNASAALAQKPPDWRIAVEGKERGAQGIMALPLSSAQSAVALKNLDQTPLHVTVVELP